MEQAVGHRTLAAFDLGDDFRSLFGDRQIEAAEEFVLLKVHSNAIALAVFFMQRRGFLHFRQRPRKALAGVTLEHKVDRQIVTSFAAPLALIRWPMRLSGR